MEIVRKRKANQVQDEEWELWKNSIRTQYLEEDKTHKHIVAKLKDEGFIVTCIFPNLVCAE